MTAIIFAIFIAFGLLLFSLAIGNENKKEMREMSTSQAKAFESIKDWANGESHIITLKKIHQWKNKLIS